MNMAKFVLRQLTHITLLDQFEFDISKQLPLSQFIQSEVDLAIATWLKERYLGLTKGYAFTEVFRGSTPSNCATLLVQSLGAP
jgi:hypothetical protein